MRSDFELEYLSGLGALGKSKAKVVDTTPYQCPKSKNAEKKAIAACAKKSAFVKVTSCKPFKYTCSTNPCPTGYTRNAAGQCAPMPNCPVGYVKDAYGRCVLQKVSCAAGYEADAYGQCKPIQAACPQGYTKDANNQCVIGGACPPGMVPDSAGRCVYPNSCPTGYSLNAYNQCVPAPCPSGYAKNAYGQCVPPVSCPAGTVQNIYGQCVPVQNCPTGYTRDNYGQCVPPSANNSVSWPSWLVPSLVAPSPVSPYTPIVMPSSPYIQPSIQPIPAGTDFDTGEGSPFEQQYSDVYAPQYAVSQAPSYGPPATWVDEGSGVDATVEQVAETEYGYQQPVSPSMEQAQGQQAASYGYPSVDEIQAQEQATMSLWGLGALPHRGVRATRPYFPRRPQLLRNAKFVG